MILKKSAYMNWSSLLALLIMAGIVSCTRDNSSGRVEEDAPTSASIEAKRFERDLFSDSLLHGSRQAFLRAKYGSYFDLFVWQLTRLGDPDSIRLEQNLTEFVSDTNFRSVYQACEKEFPDFSIYAKHIGQGFARFRQEFPTHPVPELLTTLSVFSYPVICDSSHLAIGLDMYLGPDCKFYSTLQPPLPAYLLRRMRSEYIVSDALKGWLLSDYGWDETQTDLLEQMIAAGRIQFALEKLLPSEPDTVRTGYTDEQLQWCDENENEIWSFFIDNKLLYSRNPSECMKFVGEGPTTPGFPPSSPGNIGQYVGYRIIRSYMDRHTSVRLQELMDMKDLHALFQESKYKPKR